MRPLVAFLLITTALAGCAGNGPSPGPDAGVPALFSCEHPHPCGDEWPENLTGPFELAEGYPRLVELKSFDGTVLRGWIFLPDLPEGVRAPVVLTSSPYYGIDASLPPPNRDTWGAGPIDFWVKQGYAVAAFSVRGTGISDGCFENKGAGEQEDQRVLVEWLGEQDWSNGRVGMIGVSYPGTTPWMAAINRPSHLKAIIPIGPVTDPYTELHSPQGALYTMGGPNDLLRRAIVSFAPAYVQTTDQEGLPVVAENQPSRFCPALVDVLTEAEQGHFTDDRSKAFWGERRLIDRFPDIDAAVFLAHGLLETAHPYQEDPVWATLDAPKRMLLGQWDHEVPRNGASQTDETEAWWAAQALGWFEYWLKGVGSPDKLGIAEYQDGGGAWHNSTAWPPAEAREEVLHFGEGLAPEPGDAGTFRPLPPPPGEEPDAPSTYLCGDGVPGTGLVHMTEPVAEPTLVAGNPFAYLHVSSDMPGGQFALHLYKLDGGRCEQHKLLGHGVVDLRFHAGNFQGKDFPVDRATPVRVDISNFAEPLAAGDRLAAVFSWGDLFSAREIANPLADDRYSRSGQPYFPELTIHGEDGPASSHIVVPVVEGTFGGEEPVMEYPPRPFLPVIE